MSETTETTGPTGLQVLRLAFEQGEGRPSIGRFLGMRPTRLEEGQVDFEVTTIPDFANPLGTVHGGICATLLDSAMGCAVHSTLPPGAWYTTLELSINYVRAASTDGSVLTAHGQTIHVGRSMATAEGQVHDQNGKLIAHGTTTCLVKQG
ncbi:PaaI family thioesterase [Dermacoccaceae bacterium W4C1]